MGYKKVGTIDGMSEIPFNKTIIVSGSIGDRWMYQMEGSFKKQGNEIVFRNVHEMSTKIEDDTVIGLNILEKTIA
ncbi:hypothetical protein [Oceanobacillus profundus]|uniref:hypothetical protein n=1 Tax=Oceanobacillus profundus TaxID=372463 RepID=UPI0026E11A59|nr:hypothetical protein [Oceanobacillus profundus]MDO6451741.1 hypothetical protein [Oceanobacillus profundus]